MKLLVAAMTIVAVCFGGSITARETDDVADSPSSIRPLLIGATVPELVLKTGDGKPFELNGAIARKPTILVLYRGGW